MKSRRNLVIKKLVAFSLMFAITINSFLGVPVKAYAQEQSNEKFPYTIYTADTQDSITLNIDNVTVNGDIQTNGILVNNSLNGNLNSTITESANTEMIHIHNKLQEKYFADAERHTEDYTLTEMNMNINKPLYVVGLLNLKGNVSLNSAMGAITDVHINGETINSNNSVIYSKFGNITIDCSQVSVNGLIYAPFGTVSIDCSNFNMNGIIIAKNLIVNGKCANINYNHSVAEFVGTESEDTNWSEEDLKYLPEHLKETTYVVTNPDSAVTKVSVSLSGDETMDGVTTIDSIMNKDIICTEVVGLVGEPFSIESTCSFEKATITFSVDQSKLGDTSFEDLLFLWYDEANYQFVELDTVYDVENSTVSTKTTHFSKYMIVDKRLWFDAWEVQLDYNKKNPNIPAPDFTYNTVLVIDCSGSMSSYDNVTTAPANSSYEAQYSRKCKRIDAAMRFVDSIDSGDRVGIVLFESSICGVVGLTDNKTTLRDMLQNVKSSGGTYFNAAFNKAYSLFDEQSFDTGNVNRIIFLTDGEDYLSSSTLQTAVNKGIKIYTVGLGGSTRDASLKHIAETTGGEFYKALTADELVDIYTDVGIGDDFDKTDSDGDGLYDAVEAAGIRIQNGTIIYGCDPADDDTDDDGLKDGQEIVPTIRWRFKYNYPSNVPDEGRAKEYYFYMNSSPVGGCITSHNYVNNICTKCGESQYALGSLEYENGVKARASALLPNEMNPLNIIKAKIEIKMADYEAATGDKFINDAHMHAFLDGFNEDVFWAYGDGISTELSLGGVAIEYLTSNPSFIPVTMPLEVHLFRNKLNRAPVDLESMMTQGDNWTLLKAGDSIYHMRGTDGTYNLKFVSKCGKFEAVYDKNGVLLTEVNDPVNMGTYNYCTPDNKLIHAILDVGTYARYGNISTKDLEPEKPSVRDLEPIVEEYRQEIKDLFESEKSAAEKVSEYNKIKSKYFEQ